MSYGNADPENEAACLQAPEDSVESALCFTEQSAGTSGACGAYLRRAEREALIEWCSIHSKRIEPNVLRQLKWVSEGGEHTVYRDSDSRLAIKVTHPNDYGHSIYEMGYRATIPEYLKRLHFHNLLFGDDIRIAGLLLGEEHVQIVTTQPWIKPHEENPIPDQSEIEAYFEELGFLRIELPGCIPVFFDRISEVLIADARDENILRSQSGELVPIDLVIGIPGRALTQRIWAEVAKRF